ncbi:RES domain-containing protein [Rhodococcus ruber]|uniref:RES domain-containing protein n=1 Tax=Rhodococcus TaxID=1827 RepID=UPI00058E97EE|nr:RES domain-containing protein [Rhodococcus ruber]MCD2129069.1 RES family NAD+ phosphorylase [Rhodococcus ruber]MCZ4504741.1 RES domain-containing protein [Rhodococcus ruber]MCZ4532296.1 RES domain-containing protein [Rhodococcus ruber]MCZ4622857.1 RES domain-containing protein [Rhodococcus ruber]MDI9969076.1 RES domain-containing protein [Rhodococcus ruber]
MVAPLPAPTRPLHGGRAWVWRWREPSPGHPWRWCRIYHPSPHTPNGTTHRHFGPLHRLDPHLPAPDGAPRTCPDGRSVLYVAGNLATALGEVFGDFPAAAVCPRYRVALLRPTAPVAVLDLRGQGAAMRIGALPSLATGDYPRPRTQPWARAIYEDQPVARRRIHGVYYDAAHSNGPALALWNTEDRLEVPADSRGAVQDFALAEPRMWPRVVDAAVSLGMRADLVAHCPTCS